MRWCSVDFCEPGTRGCSWSPSQRPTPPRQPQRSLRPPCQVLCAVPLLLRPLTEEAQRQRGAQPWRVLQQPQVLSSLGQPTIGNGMGGKKGWKHGDFGGALCMILGLPHQWWSKFGNINIQRNYNGVVAKISWNSDDSTCFPMHSDAFKKMVFNHHHRPGLVRGFYPWKWGS